MKVNWFLSAGPWVLKFTAGTAGVGRGEDLVTFWFVRVTFASGACIKRVLDQTVEST